MNLLGEHPSKLDGIQATTIVYQENNKLLLFVAKLSQTKPYELLMTLNSLYILMEPKSTPILSAIMAIHLETIMRFKSFSSSFSLFPSLLFSFPFLLLFFVAFSGKPVAFSRILFLTRDSWEPWEPAGSLGKILRSIAGIL